MSIHPPPGTVNIRKFQFDDFDIEDAAVEVVFDESGGIVEPPPASFSFAELEAARQAATSEGRTLAAQEAAISLTADIASALRELADQTAELIEERRAQGEFISSESVRLAAQIARRVLPAFAETNAVREVEALIASCFKDRPEEARLVIRLPDHLLDPVSARMETLMRDTGFTGKPILLADPNLKRAEARIEWANGGVEWSFEAQLADLELAAAKLAKPTAKAMRPARNKLKGDMPAQETEL